MARCIEEAFYEFKHTVEGIFECGETALERKKEEEKNEMDFDSFSGMRMFLAMVMLVVGASTLFGDEQPETDKVVAVDAMLSIKSVDYLPRGWCRIGKMGHGNFYGYSFGRTIYHGTNEIPRVEGDITYLEFLECLMLQQKRRHFIPDVFESASLCLERKSRRLVRVELRSGDIPLGEIDPIVAELRKSIDYGLALTLLRVRMGEESREAGQAQPIALFEAEDAKFISRLAVQPSTNSMGRISVSVMSRIELADPVTRPKKTGGIPPEGDMQVEMNDL